VALRGAGFSSITLGRVVKLTDSDLQIAYGSATRNDLPISGAPVRRQQS
jgi:hypothetical protein